MAKQYSSKYSGAEQDALFDKIFPLGTQPLATVARTNSYNDLDNKPDLTTKVDKVQGKGLSTNDYTTAEKTKLAGIDYNATAVGKNVTGTEYTIAGKTVVASTGAEIFNNYYNNIATGLYSHAEGANTTASGNFSHAEGAGTTASENFSHAEGSNTTASGNRSHAEGAGTTASGDFSHAEGTGATASGSYSHVEGGGTTASGTHSHAEGANTTASGNFSHAEGAGTTASENFSHAEGASTTAASSFQHVQGRYNVVDSANKFAFIIGNGTADDARSNAFAVDWYGLIYVNNAATGVDISTLHNYDDTALAGRVTALETSVGNINTVLEEVL